MLIAISHSVPGYGNIESSTYVDMNIASNDILKIVYVILMSLGQIGNVIFIISSAYFLIDSKNAKKEKIINIILDTFTISICFLISITCSKIDITTKDFIKQFFPIIFKNNWFIGCYILLYTIHPILNIIIRKFNQKGLLRINVFLIVYLFVQFIFMDKLFYSDLIGFIIIYFIVAYMKLYMQNFIHNKKINLIILILSLIMQLIMIIITNILGLRIEMLSNKMLYWNRISNIIIISIGLSLFNIISTKNFYNKIINYISSLSLIFYLMHDNYMFRIYIKPLFYENVFQYGHILLWVFLEGLMLFVGGMILAAIYKETIQRLTKKLSIKISDITTKVYLKFEKYWLEKIN